MTAAEAAPHGGEPSRSVEIELKFDADDSTPLPEWSSVPGVVQVGVAEVRELDARYLDTEDLALALAGYALRRRTGGPDAGWHIKGPRGDDGGRVELGWPLGETGELPEPVRAALRPVTDAALAPLARIENTRTAYSLRNAAGDEIAEFVDDRVTATDERAGTVRVWREWEIELTVAPPADVDAFFAAVTDAVHSAGGREAASASKLARALGY